MSESIQSLLISRERLSNRVIHGACVELHGHRVVDEQRILDKQLLEIAKELPKLGYRDRFTLPDASC